jgi:cell division protein FtsZ
MTGHREEEGDQGETQTGTGSSGGVAPRATQQPQQGVQGSLNIDASKAESTEDELDIPAFLRRQAN